MTQQHTPTGRPALSPSYPRSIAGFLRPGRDTAREGAAGTTLLAGLGAAGLLAVVLRARRRG